MTDETAPKSWWRRMRDRWRAANLRAARMEQRMDGSIAEGHVNSTASQMRRGIDSTGGIG
jgi:riboflavin synthase alpha subunit